MQIKKPPAFNDRRSFRITSLLTKPKTCNLRKVAFEPTENEIVVFNLVLCSFSFLYADSRKKFFFLMLYLFLFDDKWFLVLILIIKVDLSLFDHIFNFPDPVLVCPLIQLLKFH